MGTMGIYKPLYVWCSPASIPQIVAHIQDYLVKNPIVSTETVAEIVVQSLQEHPELINGSVIPITEDSAQTIKEYIDALPSLDGYTKAETDALLLLKQNLLSWDQTPTAGSSNPVTSEGIKAAISATAAALADLISTKADIASVYTKSVMDTLLIQKADVATTYSKNAVDALLDTKVDINDTYTKADIDLMKQVDKANTAIVSSTDGTAPLNIAAGQYVYLNDILYMATQAIPENDPLVPGTNIVLTPRGVTNNIGDGLQNLARTVGEQSDQIVNLGNAIAKVCNDATAPAGGIPANSYYYHNGVLYYTANVIAQGTTLPQGTAITNGGLNDLLTVENLSLTVEPNFTLIYNKSTKIGNILNIHALFRRDVFVSGVDPAVCSIPYRINENEIEFLAGTGNSRYGTNTPVYGYVYITNGVTKLVCSNANVAEGKTINFNLVLTIAN